MKQQRTRSEFDREFGSVYARVFAHPRSARWKEAEFVFNPFHNRNWQIVLLPEGLETCWLDPEIDADNIDRVSDAIAAWPPFFDTLTQIDTKFIIQTNRYFDIQNPSDDDVCALLHKPGIEDTSQSLFVASLGGQFDLFGPDGSWGMDCADEEPYSLLGGDEAFMSLFLEKSGGISEVRQRFYRFAEWMWTEPEYDGLRRDFWSLTGWKPPASLA